MYGKKVLSKPSEMHPRAATYGRQHRTARERGGRACRKEDHKARRVNRRLPLAGAFFMKRRGRRITARSATFSDLWGRPLWELQHKHNYTPQAAWCLLAALWGRLGAGAETKAPLIGFLSRVALTGMERRRRLNFVSHARLLDALWASGLKWGKVAVATASSECEQPGMLRGEGPSSRRTLFTASISFWRYIYFSDSCSEEAFTSCIVFSRVFVND